VTDAGDPVPRYGAHRRDPQGNGDPPPRPRPSRNGRGRRVSEAEGSGPPGGAPVREPSGAAVPGDGPAGGSRRSRRGRRRVGEAAGSPTASGAAREVDQAVHRPAHGRGRSRAGAGERDRRSVLARLPFVVAVAAVVAGAVALDRAGGSESAGRAAVAVRPDLLMPAVRPDGAGSSTWYCAAGTAVGDGIADHRVVVVNGSDEDRTATLTIVPGDVSRADGAGDEATTTTSTSTTTLAARTVTETVPAGERVDVRLGDLVGAPLAAAVVEVDGGGVAVQHAVRGPHGADLGPCATAAAPAWHLAWGATTRDARDLVVLFNPFPSAATVDGTFVTEDGPREPVRFQGFPVPARSVVGVDLGDDVTRSKQVAATFTARTGRIVVERVQQFDGTLGTEGLSLDLGVPAVAPTWVFADGAASAPTPEAAEPGATTTTTAVPAATTTTTAATASAGDGVARSEKIVVYNPGTRRARVDVGLVPGGDAAGGPAPLPFRLSVGAGSYEVVDYGGQARVAAGQPYTTVVRSTNGVGVVAERVTTDAAPPRQTGGAHPGEVTAGPGARLAARSWLLPTVGTDDSGPVTAVVFNPDPDRTLAVRLLRPVGGGALATAEVAPGARATLVLPEEATGGTDPPVALRVTADGPVVVEGLLATADGRRQSLSPALPALTGARPLDALAAAGDLAGATPPG
jgi:hypothetical protein